MRETNRPAPLSHGLLIIVLLSLPSVVFGHSAGLLYNDALSSFQAGDLAKTQEILRQVIAQFPRFAAAHHLLGLAYVQQTGKAENAITEIKQALELNPNFAQAYYDISLIFISQHQFDEAQSMLQKAHEIYPGFWEAQLVQAKLHEHTQAIEPAINEYKMVLDLKPHQEEALFRLAYIYDQEGRMDEARALLIQLVETHPRHADGWYLLGRIAERQHTIPQAIHAYQKALQADSNNLNAHFNLGSLYQSQGKVGQAITQFQAVTNLNPDYGEARLYLGILFVENHQLDKAEQEYQLAQTLMPHRIDVAYNLGTFYEFHKKDLDRALEYYRSYLKLGGKDARIRRLVDQVQK